MNKPVDGSAGSADSAVEAGREPLALIDDIERARENSGLKHTTLAEVDAWRKDG